MQYFNQTINWAKFFLQANNSSHRIWIFEENGDFVRNFICNSQGFLDFKNWFNFGKDENENENWLIIYEYPWQFGQKMWYCPRLWCNFENKLEIDKNENLDKIQLENENETRKIKIKFAKILTKIQKIAQKNQITFLKFELDLKTDLEDLEAKKELENGNNLWQKILKNEKIENLKIINSDKKLQYLSTIILDLGELKIGQNLENQTGKLEKEKNKINVKNVNELEQKKGEVSKNDLQISNGKIQNFWSQNEKIWTKLLDKRTRYGSRKSLNFWQIDSEKTEENFELFYNLCLETAKRQKFAIHPKKYLKTLFDQ